MTLEISCENDISISTSLSTFPFPSLSLFIFSLLNIQKAQSSYHLLIKGFIRGWKKEPREKKHEKLRYGSSFETTLKI